MFKKESKVFPCAQQLATTPWRRMRGGGGGELDIFPCFLELGTGWKWVVSFTPLLLCTWWPPLDRSLGGPQSQFVYDIEKWKFLAPSRLELRPLGRPSRSQSLYRIHYRSSPEFCIVIIIIKTMAFWDMTPCNFVDGYQQFGESCWLQLQSKHCINIYKPVWCHTQGVKVKVKLSP
jgi:hypothetical protein